MHTAICAFDDRQQAERAIDRLSHAGFDHRDIHLEHKSVHTDGRGDADRWSGMEREVAVDRGILKTYGDFFASLLGHGPSNPHVDTYADHVEQGSYVVVVDADSDDRARAASLVLHEHEARDMNVVHRVAQRPLREVVAERDSSMEERFGTARSEMGASHNTAGLRQDEFIRDRAMASDRGSASRPADDLEHAPGLRYADKDKPR
jgi:hypothetical protein